MRDGEQIGNTDLSGNFFLELPYGTERFTLTFRDTSFRNFLDKIHTVQLERGASGVHYDVIRLRRKEPPVDVDATEKAMLSFDMLDVVVPGNAMYTEDGDLYTVSRCIK